MEDKTSKQSLPKSIILFFVISISLVGFILIQGKKSFFNLPNRVQVKPGLPAPKFTFPGLDGKMVSLDDYKGKVVLLNIWATWCPPCRDEMPSMERMYQVLKGEDFVLIAISIDASGAKVVAPFVREYKLSFPVLLDTNGKSQTLFETTGIPESFIIDKEGILYQKIIGPRDWDSPETILFIRNLIQMPLS
jgi:peroxiredoxin